MKKNIVIYHISQQLKPIKSEKMKSINITFPLDKKIISNLKAGQFVLLNGTLYTARDAAHERLINALKNREKLPIELKDQVIYYVGPTPVRPGQVIGSAGPTTSSRMDEFVEPLLKIGLKGMIGKGSRSQKVVQACKKFKAVYFITFGGCGALLSTCIKKAKIAAYPELGCEAIFQLEIKDFPAIIGIDISGDKLFGV